MRGCGALDEDFRGIGEFGVVAAAGLGEGWSFGGGVVVVAAVVGEGWSSRGRSGSDRLLGRSWRGGSGRSAGWWWARGCFPAAEREASHEARSVV